MDSGERSSTNLQCPGGEVTVMAGKQAASRIAYSRRVALGAPDRQAFESRLQQELQAAVQTHLEKAVLAGSGGSGQPWV